MALCFHQ